MNRHRPKIKIDFKHFFHTIKATDLIVITLTIIGLLFTFGTIDRLATNWRLQETYHQTAKQLELLELEVETLELDNEYYKTTEYQELAARRLANKKFPGENLVALPDNSDVAKSKHSVSQLLTAPEYTNLQKWQMFFFPPQPKS